MTRIGPNILRYEYGQYSVNTGMGIFYTHIFVDIYVKKKTKWGYWKISWFGEVVKSDMDRGKSRHGITIFTRICQKQIWAQRLNSTRSAGRYFWRLLHLMWKTTSKMGKDSSDGSVLMLLQDLWQDIWQAILGSGSFQDYQWLWGKSHAQIS